MNKTLKTQDIISGQQSLKYLSNQGARYCKVTAYNAPGDDPGKRAFERGWQNNPISLQNITRHLASGSNVGLLCGEYSGGLCLLDADENFSKFCQTFPHLADAPRIERDGANRGKILIKIIGPIPEAKRWTHDPKDKHPFFEFLATGRQGVVAGIHPSGVTYQLVNSQTAIPELTQAQLKDICVSWTKQPWNKPKAKATKINLKRRTSQEYRLTERVREYWDVLKVFDHFGLAGDVVSEGEYQLRLKGNGGLLIVPDENIWSLPAEGKGVGGSSFEAWMYCKTSRETCEAPNGKEFIDLVHEMAIAAGIEYAVDERDKVLGEKLSKTLVEAVESHAKAIPCPDPEFEELMFTIFSDRVQLARDKKKDAEALLLKWLTEHGQFIISETGEGYYLYKPQHRLFKLSTNLWRGWLYSLTGSNPASPEFAYFIAACETASLLGQKRSILKVAAWDKDEQVLRVSRFDGVVYKLDGETISEEGNGENVLFNDDPSWEPYLPDFSEPGTFVKLANAYWEYSDLTKRDSELEQYKLALRVWELSTFFIELHPTRPALAIVGPKGSGKSMALRRFIRSVFGNQAELSGVPDKSDGFTSAAAGSHIYALDNLDGFYGWMRDKIALQATGSEDHYRKLYTNNELGRIVYRCWLAFTSRTPDTLRRDDLVDRLVILPVTTIPEKYLKAERSFLDADEQTRSAWWGDVLTMLNKIVTNIRAGKLKSKSTLRMADWESFGRLVAQIENNESVWEKFISQLKKSQTGMLLEGDMIVDAILNWLEGDSANYGKSIFGSSLYQELTAKMYAIPTSSRLPKEWPDSAKKFCRRLQMVREAMKNVLDVEWSETKLGVKYRFFPLTTPTIQ
jgi:hypothetical protein